MAPPFDVEAYVEEGEAEEEAEFVGAAPSAPISDDDPPFDPPDDDLGALTPEEEACAAEAPKPAIEEAAEPPPKPAPDPARVRAPAISIYASWDRAEIAASFAAFARDPALSRARVEIARGGLDAAIERCAEGRCPDLVIVDTTLAEPQILAGLARLRRSLSPGARVIFIGAVNDIGLLRALAQRGVSEYLMAPMAAEDLVAATCRLFAEQDRARVIAVMGARGGVGASTLARSIAWSIAERLDAGCTFVDLDFAFGGAPGDAPAMASYALLAPNADVLMDNAAQPGQRLLKLPAPASLAFEHEPDPLVLATAIQAARRSNPYVILDLPHKWTPWVRRALADADDVVIVAGPDLASLRNADAIVKEIKPARGQSPPLIAMTMIGVPKRPEISLKDFVEAVGETPVALFAYDPELYGAADSTGAALGACAPRSRAAAQVDDLASALTGLTPQPRRKRPAESALELTVRAESTPEPAPAKPADEISAAAVTRRARAAKPKKRSRGYIRMAACIAILFALIAWQGQRESAASAPPAVSAE